MSIVVVIPAYNEERVIGEVLRQFFAFHVPRSALHVLVIDDGSTDRTAQVASDAGAIVLRHPINRGLGGALATGIAGALQLITNQQMTNNPVIVTLDADGQHDPAEIPQMIQPILDGEADVVIGSRFKSRIQNPESRMPLSRKFANWCGNFFTWLLFGIWVTDSQSGFRAFSVDAARRLQLRTSTMEVSSEIIREIARLHLRVVEVPITVRYTEYSLSKGQGFLRGLQTLWKLIVLRFFR